MENTIDLRKTGAENIIGKFSKKNILLNILYLVRENGSFIVEQYLHMTARQAETILMLSDFLKTPVVILSIVRIENQRLMSCENTVFELAMLVRTMAKGVAGAPSMISLCTLATAMYVMSIMADTKSIKSLSD
jgi:hypothetical protein